MDKRKPIGSFNDFIKKENKINEDNKVAIDVPFWHEAIDKVMAELHNVACKPIIWDLLVDFVKDKLIVLDRENNGDENSVISHIKDLLFQFYGKAFLSGEFSSSYSAENNGAKSIVFAKLADEIIKKVQVEAGLFAPDDEIQQPISTISLENEKDSFEEKYAVKDFDSYVKLMETLGDNKVRRGNEEIK